MERPDFSRYTEQQLRTILKRLDRERFPERLVEIETCLAGFDSNKVNETQPEIPAGEHLLISSRVSVFTTVIFPIVWFGMLLFFAFAFLVSNDKSLAEWLILLVLFIVAVMSQFKINRLVEEVYLAGDTMILVRKGVKECVRLKSISEVEISNGETTTVVLHLACSTQFGQRIEFLPASESKLKPFKGRAIVDELKRRIAAAKAQVDSSENEG